jgi:hypothetical protein
VNVPILNPKRTNGAGAGQLTVIWQNATISVPSIVSQLSTADGTEYTYAKHACGWYGAALAHLRIACRSLLRPRPGIFGLSSDARTPPVRSRRATFGLIWQAVCSLILPKRTGPRSGLDRVFDKPLLMLGEHTMAANANPQKKVDLPPTGNRNTDPLSKAPGAHPIEAGIGAAAVGAAGGLAAGAVTGPIGAAVGAVVGAVAGGYAGKGIGEMIDPTTEDNWLRENFKSRPYVRQGETFETYHPAYHFGAQAESLYGEREFDVLEPELQHGWNDQDEPVMPWEKARGAVKDSYERTVQLRRARDVPEVCDDPLED